MLKKRIEKQAKVDEIKKILKEQDKSSLFHTWISTIISITAGFLISYSIFESVVVSSTEIITNNTIEITFKNGNLFKPTSKLVVWGWDPINGEIVLDSLTKGYIEPQQSITRTYDIDKINMNISLENFEINPKALGAFKIPAGKVFIRNTLFYRITCVDCEGQEYWRPLREEQMSIGLNLRLNNETGRGIISKGDYTQIFWKNPNSG